MATAPRVKRRHAGWSIGFGLCLLTRSATALGGAANDTIRDLTQATKLVTNVVGRAFGGSLPVPTASFGVQYTFDPDTASFVRAPAVSGQIYVERAETMGRHHLNLSVAWERVVLDQIGGQPAAELPAGHPIRLAPNQALAVRFGPTRGAAATDRIVPSLTLGLTDELDVSLTMPVVLSNIGVRAKSVLVARGSDGLFASVDTSQESVHEWGAGDLLLSAKYRLPTGETLPLAAGLALRLPTGDVDQLRGTGTTFVTPQLAASTRRWAPATWTTLQAYLDLAIDLDAQDVGASIPRWGIGIDWGLGESLTLALAFLGRHPLRRLAPIGALDSLRCPTLSACLASPRNIGRRPLYNIDAARPDYFDASVGGRVALWRDTIIGFANVVVPLNNAGVRFEPIPLVGMEATF